jgi:hypothetical protein
MLERLNHLSLILTIIAPMLYVFHFPKPRGFSPAQMKKSSRRVELQISLIDWVKKHNKVTIP